MRKKRRGPPDHVLYVSSVSGLGGAELTLIDMITSLDRERFVPHLLVGNEGPLVDHLRRKCASIEFGNFPFFSKRRPWIYAKSLLRIVALIRSRWISILHVNCDQAVPHAVVAARLTGVPVLCHIHDTTRAWFKPRYVRYLNRCSRIIANSQATARHCVAAGMAPEKLQVIYECFEMDRFRNVPDEERRSLRAQWGIPDHAIAVGLVGQILRHKGHEQFIEAAAMAARQYPNTRFLIVGDDSLSNDPDFHPSLRTAVEELGMTQKIKFVGFRHDVERVMAALDIVAVPSHAEPFGRVVVEALAAERPVLATEAGGIPEIIDNGVNGILVPPEDPQTLAEGLISLIEKPGLRKKCAERGPQTAKKFDVKLHASQFERTYQALLEGDPERLPRVPFGEPTWLDEAA